MQLSPKQKKEIRTALQALLGRGNFDTFVIITEQSTNKFIQFAVNEDTLLFDLPSQQLNEDQLARVKQILSPYGILFKVEKAYDSKDRNTVVGEFGVFNQRINNDLDLAIELIEKIMTQVFDIVGEINFSLEEN